VTVPTQFPHQAVGTRWLLEKAEPYALVGDEMRVGKTREVIDAAQELHARRTVDSALVVAPVAPRLEWADPDPRVGQLAKFLQVPAKVIEYRSGRSNEWTHDVKSDLEPMEWIVTNYEFMRRKERLKPLLRFVDERTVLVLDESAAVGNFRSQQAKACQALAKRAGWVWLLNGTPWGDNPEDLFGQFYCMDWRVIGCQYISDFRARYAVMNPHVLREVKVKTPAGWRLKKVPVKVDKWVNLDDLSRRTAPHVIRRTCREVFPDMPPQLDPVTVTVPLKRETWKVYQEMRKESVAWLRENVTASAVQAGVRMMRLAQITAGFVGGVECGACFGTGLEFNLPCSQCGGVGKLDPQPVGSEKLDAAVAWFREQLKERPDFKAILWCRFRPEVKRLAAALAELVPTRTLTGVASQEEREARDETLRMLHPGTAGLEPLAVVGTASTGAKGLNMAAASTMAYVSSEWSLDVRSQSSFRIVGPDQTEAAAYFDFVATGPQGEPTVDRDVVVALRDKRDVARRTAAEWLSAVEG
jgi:hypothetical protein